MRYTRDERLTTVPPQLRKTHLIQDKIEARRQETDKIDKSFLLALQNIKMHEEQRTSGIYPSMPGNAQTTQSDHSLQTERARFAAAPTVHEMPAIRPARVTQASPHIDFCGSLIEYRDPLHRPGYLSLTGATLEYIRARQTYPRALIASYDMLPIIIKDITSVDGTYEGLFYFRKEAIRVMTDKDIPQWLAIVLNGSIPRDIIYAIA